MRTSTRPLSRPARLAAAVLAGSLSLGLAACSGFSGDSGAASGAVDGGGSAVAEQSAPEARQDFKGSPGVVDGDTVTGSAPDQAQRPTTVQAAIADRKLARRADVALRVDDVTKAAAGLRAVAARAGGLVVAEEVSSDVDAPESDTGGASIAPSGYGTVTISVPTDKLDATLDAVAALGTVLSRNTSTDDVTGTYVDTAARVETMKASVERVRALMTRATKLADIVTLEAELSRRQAELESMQQQLAALDDQVALAPITVTLSTTGAKPPVEEDPTGFLAGLASGWDAFTTSIRLLLTLLGAVLPFAVAIALVVGPLTLWWRRRRAGEPVVAPTPTAPVA